MSADKLSTTQRSKIMRSVKSKDTSPEILVRSILHSIGFRFRLHRKDLPGTPDIVLPKYKTAIFIHGCFWHRHKNCKFCSTPKTNTDFWQAKFDRNVSRDHKNLEQLKKAGWKTIVVWQCETDDKENLIKRFFMISSSCNS